MAKKKFDIKAVLMAAGGGAAANTVMNLAESKIAFLQDKPVLIPILPAAVGTLGAYFMDDQYKPLFYGMIGAAGGEVIDSLGILQGLSRMNYQIDGLEDLDNNPLAEWSNEMNEAVEELEQSDNEDYLEEMADD